MGARSVFFHSSDGLRLHARVHGEAGGGKLPVVCLAGLTRNARDFERFAERLLEATPRLGPVVAFDYRGRGLSDRDANWRNYNLPREMEDVLTGLAALNIERAAFVGTSRGGLILHLLAASQPGLPAAVVLNDVGPELGLAGLAQIRGYLMNRAEPKDWHEAVTAQKAVHGAAFPALGEADWQRMARNLYREQDGRPVLDFDPALVNTLADLDLARPLPDLWTQFDSLAALPALVIRSEHSRLLEAQTVHRMHARHPSLESLTVSGQGHAPILDSGDLPLAIAGFFLRKLF